MTPEEITSYNERIQQELRTEYAEEQLKVFSKYWEKVLDHGDESIQMGRVDVIDFGELFELFLSHLKNKHIKKLTEVCFSGEEQYSKHGPVAIELLLNFHNLRECVPQQAQAYLDHFNIIYT